MFLRQVLALLEAGRIVGVQVSDPKVQHRLERWHLVSAEEYRDHTGQDVLVPPDAYGSRYWCGCRVPEMAQEIERLKAENERLRALKEKLGATLKRLYRCESREPCEDCAMAAAAAIAEAEQPRAEEVKG